MTQVSIRLANPADAALLSEIAAETFRLACPPGTTDENIRLFIEEKLSESAFTHYLANKDYRVWVAFVDEECAGYAMAVHGEPQDQDIAHAVAMRPTMELSKIYVRREHHGAGVSQQLMRVALEHAGDHGAVSVWLGVNKMNERANSFYNKHGFAIVGTRFFQVGESTEADYVREVVL